MIFLMSKRVFLNVMCPLMEKNVLLNANYYIADCNKKSASYNTRASEDVRNMYFDEIDGQWKENKEDQNNNENNNHTRGIVHPSSYNIQYTISGCLNLSPYVTTFFTDGQDDRRILEREFYKRTISWNNMKNIYDEIYVPARRGNGILFIIYYSDENIVNFGGFVSEFLAEHFGEDVSFVDPGYRPYVPGKTMYKGNKERSEMVMKDFNDASMVISFRTHLSAYADEIETYGNLTNHMSKFKFADAIRLYELLWPDDPLPPGNYTTEQVKEIIINRSMDNKNLQVGNDEGQNIPISQRMRNMNNVYHPGGGY